MGEGGSARDTLAYIPASLYRCAEKLLRFARVSFLSEVVEARLVPECEEVSREIARVGSS